MIPTNTHTHTLNVGRIILRKQTVREWEDSTSTGYTAMAGLCEQAEISWQAKLDYKVLKEYHVALKFDYRSKSKQLIHLCIKFSVRLHSSGLPVSSLLSQRKKSDKCMWLMLKAEVWQIQLPYRSSNAIIRDAWTLWNWMQLTTKLWSIENVSQGLTKTISAKKCDYIKGKPLTNFVIDGRERTVLHVIRIVIKHAMF